jgi:hypothetical protein
MERLSIDDAAALAFETIRDYRTIRRETPKGKAATEDRDKRLADAADRLADSMDVLLDALRVRPHPLLARPDYRLR